MKRVPRNTTKETAENPIDFLVLAMVTGTSNAIERQEAEGQESFVESATLPVDMSRKDKQILMDCGVKFGEVVEGDPLFQYAKLPEGWTVSGTDHSMHSELLDENSNKRAGIFYKAAFYDRSASLQLTRKYGYTTDWNRMDEKQESVCQVKDGDTAIFSTEPVAVTEDCPSYEANDMTDAKAKSWLNENYPGWENPAAYWN